MHQCERYSSDWLTSKAVEIPFLNHSKNSFCKEPGIDLTGIVGLAFLVDSILKLPVTIAGDVDGVDVDGVVIRDEAGSDGVIEVKQLVRARIFDTEFKQIKSRTLFLTYNKTSLDHYVLKSYSKKFWKA